MKRSTCHGCPALNGDGTCTIIAEGRKITITPDMEHGCCAAPDVENYEPVIRCENCDMWNTLDSAGRKSLGNYVCSCTFWTKEDGPVAYTRPNDFCSYGVRRDNDD